MKRTKKLLALVLSLAMIMSVAVAPQMASANINIAAGAPDAADVLKMSYSGTSKYVEVTVLAGGAPTTTTGLGKSKNAFEIIPKTLDAPAAGKYYVEAAAIVALFNDAAKKAGIPDNAAFVLHDGLADSAAGDWKYYTGIGADGNGTGEAANLVDDALYPIIDNLKSAGFRLEAAPEVAANPNGFTAPSTFTLDKNSITLEPKPVTDAFTATINNLIPNHTYKYSIVMTLDNVDYTLKEGTIAPMTATASKHSATIKEAWDGTYIDSKGDKKQFEGIDKENVLYTLQLSDTAAYGNNSLNAANTVSGVFTSNPEGSTAYDYTITAQNIDKLTITPVVESTIAITTKTFVNTTMGDLYCIIMDKDDNCVAAIKNTGTDLNPTFPWNGTYVWPESGVPVDYKQAKFFEKGKEVGKGTYKVIFKSVNTPAKGPADLTVNAAGNLLYTVVSTYADSKSASINYLIPKDGKATVTINANKAGIPVTLTFKNKAGEVVHTVALATSGLDNAATAVYSGWTGLLTDGKTYIEEGLYTLEAVITGTTTPITKGEFQVGAPSAITAVTTRDALVSLPLGVASKVELAFNDPKADVSDILSITLDKANEFFTVDEYVTSWKGKNIVLVGKKLTTETVSAPATVVLNDGKKTELKMTFRVQVVPAATGIQLTEKFIRGAAGTTGKTVGFKFLPEGAVGNDPVFYPVTKGADGSYTKLEGEKLEAAKLINSVDEEGNITFTAPERILYVADYNGVKHEFAVLTTVTAAQEMAFYPADGEITIPAGVMADPAKQPRVAAYVRPVFVADTKVTYTTSDPTKVSFLYATFAGATSITNDSVTVPAGGNAGALVGITGEATITATSSAKTATNEVLSQSILVKVAAQ